MLLVKLLLLLAFVYSPKPSAKRPAADTPTYESPADYEFTKRCRKPRCN